MTASPITQTAAAPADKIQQNKLVAGAHEFEAMLLQQMLKPLQFGEAAGADAETDSDGNSGGANDTIRSLSVEAVSKAIAQAGGVGIARQIIQQIEQQSRQTEPADESAVIKSAGTKVS